jgi:hypothetical protein
MKLYFVGNIQVLKSGLKLKFVNKIAVHWVLIEAQKGVWRVLEISLMENTFLMKRSLSSYENH